MLLLCEDVLSKAGREGGRKEEEEEEACSSTSFCSDPLDLPEATDTERILIPNVKEKTWKRKGGMIFASPPQKKRGIKHKRTL